jgi:hypothetical protein
MGREVSEKISVFSFFRRKIHLFLSMDSALVIKEKSSENLKLVSKYDHA